VNATVRLPRPIGWRIVAAGAVLLAIWAGYLTMSAHYARPWLGAGDARWLEPSHQVYAVAATLVVETLAVIATLGARFRFGLIARAELLVAVMIASAICACGMRTAFDVVAEWNVLVVLWLVAVVVAIKVARVWRELLARRRRGF
jgi:hypothetical protein